MARHSESFVFHRVGSTDNSSQPTSICSHEGMLASKALSCRIAAIRITFLSAHRHHARSGGGQLTINFPFHSEYNSVNARSNHRTDSRALSPLIPLAPNVPNC